MDGSMMRLRDIESRLPPGFRFHPSDEELVRYYLRGKVAAAAGSQSSPLLSMVEEVDLHVREPWDLPVAAKLGDKEWYFFSSRDRKYATGSRMNRATRHGYWKATGKDKVIHGGGEHGGMMTMMGMRKTLVFYLGRAPNGRKSDWVMHEFRLVTSTGSRSAAEKSPTEDWVMCRVFYKGKGGEDHHGGSKHLIDMIASPPALCSPAPRPAVDAVADNLDGGQLFPISISCSSPTITRGQLVDDEDHALIIMGRDARPAPSTIQLQAAAYDDGSLQFSEWPDTSSAQIDMDYGGNCIREMMQQGGNYFP